MFNKISIFILSALLLSSPVFAAPIPVPVSETNLFPDRKITTEGSELVARMKKLLNKKYFDIDTFDELYGGEQRNVGNKILDLAIMSWIDPDPAIREVMLQWCEKALTKEEWGNNLDLEISHLLFGLSVVYDWNKTTLPDGLKTKMREFIYNHAKFQYAFARTNISWSVSYWQNHGWIDHSSILASSIALADDYPEAKKWFEYEKNEFKKIVLLQPAYGSNQEGLNYSLYGNVWLVRAFTMLQGKGVNYFAHSDYLKNYYKFYKAYSINEKMDKFYDVGDSPSFLWYNPTEVFYKLFKEFNVPAYKELYDLYYDYKSPVAGLMSAVYGIENVTPRATVALNANDFFKDIGVYVEHDIVNGSTKNSFFFKSGIPGGRWSHAVYNKNSKFSRLNTSHNHPDQNHFIVRTPEGALIADTGNSGRSKSTEGHNTLVIDGVGQAGEGKKWFDDETVNAMKFSRKAGLIDQQIFYNEAVTILSANAAEFYPEKIGLNKFVRSVVWIKALGFLVYDAVNLKTAADASIFFHSDFNYRSQSTNAYYLEDSNGILGGLTVLYPLTPKIEVQKHTEAIKPEKEPKGEFLTVSQNFSNDGYFLTSIFTDTTLAQPTFLETESQFQVDFIKGKSYVVMLKKQNAPTITYKKYVSDANIIVFSIDENKAYIFGGTRLANRGQYTWKANVKSNALTNM